MDGGKGLRRVTEGTKLFRVQAADGRGPWRPGLSKHWIDDSSMRPLPKDVLAAFGSGWLRKIPHGWHAGCACRTLGALLEWFTTMEQRRLESMGYTPVSLRPDLIIAENEDQVVFARRLPLSSNIVLLPWRQAA